MRHAPIYLFAAGLLAASGTALADRDPDSAAPGASDPTAAPVTAPAAAPAGGGINEASLVVPKGKLDVHATLPVITSTTTSTDPMTMLPVTTTATEAFFLIGGTYGAADKLEVGAEYDHGIHPSGGAGALNAHVAYAALHNDKLDVAVAADVVLGIDSGADKALLIGGWARYHLAPKISLFTGNPGMPSSTLLGGASGPSSGAYQLLIGLNDKNIAILSLPVGAGFQATPNLYAFASTTLAEFDLHNSANAFLFKDILPINVGGYFSVNDKLDVGAEISDDLENAGKSYSFAFTGRYWVK